MTQHDLDISIIINIQTLCPNIYSMRIFCEHLIFLGGGGGGSCWKICYLVSPFSPTCHLRPLFPWWFPWWYVHCSNAVLKYPTITVSHSNLSLYVNIYFLYFGLLCCMHTEWNLCQLQSLYAIYNNYMSYIN